MPAPFHSLMEYIEHPDYFEVLTKNRDHILFDIQDKEFAKSHNWYLNDLGYVRTSVVDEFNIRYIVTAHKLLLNPPKEAKIRFKDGNKLNLRRDNLIIIEKNKTNIPKFTCKNTRCTFHNLGTCFAENLELNKFGKCITFVSKEPI
jgi:hypothetical protein